MTYFVVGLIIVLLLAIIILVALWKSTQLRENTTQHNLNAMTGNYESATQGLLISEAARKDEKKRNEAAVAALRAEIAALESDLYACNSPALVRERLRKLLQSSVPEAPSSGAGTGPLGAVPYGSAPKP